MIIVENIELLDIVLIRISLCQIQQTFMSPLKKKKKIIRKEQGYSSRANKVPISRCGHESRMEADQIQWQYERATAFERALSTYERAQANSNERDYSRWQLLCMNDNLFRMGCRSGRNNGAKLFNLIG